MTVPSRFGTQSDWIVAPKSSTVRDAPDALVSFAAVTVLPIYNASIGLVTRFLPKLEELLHFAAVMAEIPLVWFIIVKIAALLTSGITFYNDSILIRCSKWNSFHTVVGDRDNVVKVEIEQNLLQKISKRCAVSIWFGSEEYKRYKVKALSEADGLKIAETLGYSVKLNH